jgi:hypothetical protein
MKKCECGCGQPAPIAKKTRRGYVKGEPMRFIQGHHLRTAEGKAKLFTPQRNAKIGEFNRHGRIYAPATGADSPHFKGQDVSYTRMHGRLLEERGPASACACVSCGEPADEWALDHSYPAAFKTENGKPYCTDMSAYVPVCRSCHRLADARGGFRA